VRFHSFLSQSGTYRPFNGGALYQGAFIYRNDTMLNLENVTDSSGQDYRLYSAASINEAKQILVDAIKISTNSRRAVVLTPNLALTTAASRKTHGTFGAFDLDLRFPGMPQRRCRRNEHSTP
jgi:hypothetical protein